MTFEKWYNRYKKDWQKSEDEPPDRLVAKDAWDAGIKILLPALMNLLDEYSTAGLQGKAGQVELQPIKEELNNMKNLLNEYVEIVQHMTDENDHTGAIVVMAQYLQKKTPRSDDAYKLVKSAQAVETLHSFYGHMPTHLNIARDEVAERIESFMTPEEVKAFQRAR